MRKAITNAASGAAGIFLFDDWADAIEDGFRSRVRGFIETMLEEEVDGALSRPRYGRREANGEGAPPVVGVRHGHRRRTLTGTFGKTEISVPRARLTGADGKTREWKSASLQAYQRRTKAAEALIAGAYLAGTNTRRALSAIFVGSVGKDIVSRAWHKAKGDWEAWNARSLAGEPIVRLILDGTVVRVRLDRKATAISLLVALGVRADGQKVLLAIRSMGGEAKPPGARCSTTSSGAVCRRPSCSSSTARRAWKARWRRCGLSFPAALHGAQASQSPRPRARAAARGNLQRLSRHDLRRDKAGDRSAPQGLPAQMAAEMPHRSRQPGGSRRKAVRLHALPAGPVEIDQVDECDRASARGIQATDQDAGRPALRGNRGNAVLGPARLRPDRHAQDRRMADAARKANRSNH